MIEEFLSKYGVYLIAFLGWVFTAWQVRENRSFQKNANDRERKQQKLDRIQDSTELRDLLFSFESIR